MQRQGKRQGKPTKCCTKRGYKDRIDALLALADTQRRGRDEIRAYRCHRCKDWHLTSEAHKDA